jgi:uncharacterized protein YceK
MRLLIGTLFCLSLLTAVTGCGTVMNVVDREPTVYGGTRTDVALIRREKTWSETEAPLPLVTGSAAVMAFVDLPFSLVGDTLTLPLTAFVIHDEVLTEPQAKNGKGETTTRGSQQ